MNNKYHLLFINSSMGSLLILIVQSTLAHDSSFIYAANSRVNQPLLPAVAIA